MLHLLQINLVIYGVVALAVVTVLVLAGTSLDTAAQQGIRYGGLFSLATVAMMSIGWRFIPFIGRLAFPNISGDWQGQIDYLRNSVPGSIDATLHVDQDLRSISLILLTAKAESETLAVHPAKLTNGRYAVHYIYETRTRPGQLGPVYKYRGTAELRLEDKGRALVGTYYTEQNNSGSVRFTRVSPRQSWWRFWA